MSAQLGSKDELGRMAAPLDRAVGPSRQVVGGVKRAADSVASIATRLAGEADHVLKRAIKPTDGMTEIRAAMQESSVAVTEVAQNADGVEKAALDAR